MLLRASKCISGAANASVPWFGRGVEVREPTTACSAKEPPPCTAEWPFTLVWFACEKQRRAASCRRRHVEPCNLRGNLTRPRPCEKVNRCQLASHKACGQLGRRAELRILGQTDRDRKRCRCYYHVSSIPRQPEQNAFQKQERVFLFDPRSRTMMLVERQHDKVVHCKWYGMNWHITAPPHDVPGDA